MYKKGFTLAEVLVTLGIIGIITAIVIPQFTANVYNQSYASKLSTIVSDYENIFGMMMLKENKDSIYETTFGQSLSGNSLSDFETALDSYTKYLKTGSSTSALGYIAYNSMLVPAAYAGDEEAAPKKWDESPEEFKPKEPKPEEPKPEEPKPEEPVPEEPKPEEPVPEEPKPEEPKPEEPKPEEPEPEEPGSGTPGIMKTIKNADTSISFNFGLVTPSGANIMFTKKPSSGISTVYIDVNGASSPNKYGRDVFAFALDEEGHLLPYGSKAAASALGVSNPGNNVWNNNSAGDSYKCNGGSNMGNGLGCTARLMEKNYKVDY